MYCALRTINKDTRAKPAIPNIYISTNTATQKQKNESAYKFFNKKTTTITLSYFKQHSINLGI